MKNTDLQGLIRNLRRLAPAAAVAAALAAGPAFAQTTVITTDQPPAVDESKTVIHKDGDAGTVTKKTTTVDEDGDKTKTVTKEHMDEPSSSTTVIKER